MKVTKSVRDCDSHDDGDDDDGGGGGGGRRQKDSTDASGVQLRARGAKRKHSFLGYFPSFGTSHRKPYVLHHLIHTDTNRY